MDIQAFVDGMNLATKLEAGKEYNLGKLIKDLESHDKDLEVIIDNGTFPIVEIIYYAEEGDNKEYDDTLKKDYHIFSKETDSIFISYRGQYNMLAMQYSCQEDYLKVEDILRMAKFVKDKYLRGYKGGDYLMDKATPIYIDNYGDCRGVKLIGTKIEDNKVILITRKEDDD